MSEENKKTKQPRNYFIINADGVFMKENYKFNAEGQVCIFKSKSFARHIQIVNPGSKVLVEI